jgi:hypothetical protein
LGADGGPDPKTRLDLLVNLGAARIAAGNPTEGKRLCRVFRANCANWAGVPLQIV